MNARIHACIAGAVLLALGLPLSPARADEVEGGGRHRAFGATSLLDERNSNLPDRDGGLAARIGGLDVEAGEVIELAVMRERAPADGRATVGLRIRLLDRDGRPLQRPVRVLLETDLGRYLSPDEQAGHDPVKFLEDRDRREPGLVLEVADGEASAELQAPYLPGEARLRISSGRAEVETTVRFEPDLRPMLVVGVLDGLLRFRSTSSDAGAPARLNDGLEEELGEIGVNASGDSETAFLGRGALFAKGEVGNGFLVTLAYDSNKQRQRMFRDIQPDQFYPIYGDASQKGFDAQSTQRGYLRVDRGRSNFLFGDYSTEESPGETRSLGLYSRSMTGVRWRLENDRLRATSFAARDAQRQVIDEQPGRGVSGPYALSRGNGIVNSEKVELVTRDRNQPSMILAVQPLVRFSDYEFEPFSGRLLFRKPIPTVDANLNPISIRVTYEVDDGGPQFWVYGGNAAVKLGERLELGAGYARDEDPNRPYELASVNARLELGAATTLVAEYARSDLDDLQLSTGREKGNAWRTELRHDGERLGARLFYGRSASDFNNLSATLGKGRREAGGKASYLLSDSTEIVAEALSTADALVGAERQGASLLIGHRFNDVWRLDVGGRYAKDEVDVAAGAGVLPSYASVYNLVPAGGLPVGAFENGALRSGENTSVRAKLSARVHERAQLYLEAEQGLDQADAYAIALGGDYLLGEKTRLYARHEYSKSLLGLYGLNESETSRATVFGIDSAYMSNGQVFSEYRMRDAISGREGEAALGLRNLWRLREGLGLSTSFERLQAVAGDGRHATAATLGLEYTKSENWKGSTRLEWRNDDAAVSWLSTVAYTARLSRDWSLLFRNLYSETDNKDATQGTRKQDRFIVGAAYRDVDTNVWQSLLRYELKREDDSSALDPFERTVHVFSAHANVRPTRSLTLAGQLAGKWVAETFETGLRDTYHAQLASGRVIYDLNERFDIGVVGSALRGKGGALQYGAGVEVGMVLVDDLWLSLGFNITGFADDDLVDSDYTRRGVYFRIRYKFDEDLLAGAGIGR